MVEDYQEEHRKKLARVRSFVDYIWGTLFFIAGIFFLTYEKFGINIFKPKPSFIDYVIGGLFVLYGIWRIYRGYKKDYFA